MAREYVFIVDARYAVHWEPDKDSYDDADDAIVGLQNNVDDMLRDVTYDVARDVASFWVGDIDYSDYAEALKKENEIDELADDLTEQTLDSVKWVDGKTPTLILTPPEGRERWNLDAVLDFTMEVIATGVRDAVKQLDKIVEREVKNACCFAAASRL